MLGAAANCRKHIVEVPAAFIRRPLLFSGRHAVVKETRPFTTTGISAACASGGFESTTKTEETPERADCALRIGIIGTGNVGSAVAKNLLRCGYNLVNAFDSNSKNLAELPKNITRTKNARELVEDIDVVITALPRPSSVKAAFRGPDGILAGLREGVVCIDHTSSDYILSEEIASEVSEKGATFLAAPITGSLPALLKGQQVVYVGGDEAVCEKVTPILKASYQTVIHVASVGAAQICKITGNMLWCVHIVAAAEMMMIAKRYGLDLQSYWDAIRASCGNSFVWETVSPDIFKGTYHPTFTMDLMCKDNQLLQDFAESCQVPILLSGVVKQIYDQALYKYGKEAGSATPARLLEDMMKENLQIEGFEEWDYDVRNQDGSLVVKHHNINRQAKT